MYTFLVSFLQYGTELQTSNPCTKMICDEDVGLTLLSEECVYECEVRPDDILLQSLGYLSISGFTDRVKKNYMYTIVMLTVTFPNHTILICICRRIYPWRNLAFKTLIWLYYILVNREHWSMKLENAVPRVVS